MNSQKSVRNVQAEHKMNSDWIKHYQGYDLTPFDKHKHVRNFTPGPTNLPYHVFKQIGRDIFEQKRWKQGVSPLEISHRSPEFLKIRKNCENLTRKLLHIPKNYHILWTHGGGNGQFSSVPLNLFQNDKPAGYYVNGCWSKKASMEAEKFGDVVNLNNEDDLQEIIERDYSYLYFCSNETVEGIEFREDGFALPKRNKYNTPVVVDMSSDLFSKNIDWSKIDVAFACAPKNFGIAGSTIVIINEELLTDAFRENISNKKIPSILNWRLFRDSDSCFNTLPVFNIYVTERILVYYFKKGGVAEMESKAKTKSDLLYNYLDKNRGFYRAIVQPHTMISCRQRSRMNVPFTVKDNETNLTLRFLREAYKHNIVGLRTRTPFPSTSDTIEPLRVSLYNGIGVDDVEYLIVFMEKFKNEV